jgi:hypothetical protein
MKKFRFLFLVLALILVVGMTTGLIVRKQTGGQTVLQHSAQSPAQTTPATDDSVQEQVDPFEKILLLVNHDEEHPVVVVDNGVEIDPIDTYWINGEPPAQSGAKPATGTNYVPFDRYLVTPGASSFTVQSSLNVQQKGGSGSDDDSPEEYSFEFFEFRFETGGYRGEVYLPSLFMDESTTATAGVPVSIDEDTYCVLVYLGEYTFVSH